MKAETGFHFEGFKRGYVIAQGEPEFERLKRELEEVKNAPRGLEGTFRTAAEMERHRAQLADAAIEEQLEVQTAFREHGARLQSIYDKRQRTDVEMARREQEMKQLQGVCARLPAPLSLLSPSFQGRQAQNHMSTDGLVSFDRIHVPGRSSQPADASPSRAMMLVTIARGHSSTFLPECNNICKKSRVSAGTL